MIIFSQPFTKRTDNWEQLFLLSSTRNINELMYLKWIPTFYIDLKQAYMCLDANK